MKIVFVTNGWLFTELVYICDTHYCALAVATMDISVHRRMANIYRIETELDMSTSLYGQLQDQNDTEHVRA